MGVFHFAPVGNSPGAVTSALAYLKQNQHLFSVRGQIVESVVIFASPEVREGRERVPDECVYNDYGGIAIRRSWKRGAVVLDVILDFIKEEMAPVMPSKGAVYACVLEPTDYDGCFEKVAKTALHFAPPGSTGKNIWANLTGGTNVMNAALLQVAMLSGLISRLYYTFVPRVEDHKYLQPVAKNEPYRFRWDEIPPMKTALDDVYVALLDVLKGLGEGWYLDEELLARLRQVSWEHLPPASAQSVAEMDIQVFRQEYLNKLDGRELERQILPDGSQGKAVRLSEAGKRLLERIESPLFQALVQRGRGMEVEVSALTTGLDLEELWSKP